jgi:hypothetical protein
MYIYIYTYYVYILVGYSHGRFIQSPKCHHRYYDNLPQCKSWPGAAEGHRVTTVATAQKSGDMKGYKGISTQNMALYGTWNSH